MPVETSVKCRVQVLRRTDVGREREGLARLVGELPLHAFQGQLGEAVGVLERESDSGFAPRTGAKADRRNSHESDKE